MTDSRYHQEAPPLEEGLGFEPRWNKEEFDLLETIHKCCKEFICTKKLIALNVGGETIVEELQGEAAYRLRAAMYKAYRHVETNEIYKQDFQRKFHFSMLIHDFAASRLELPVRIVEYDKVYWDVVYRIDNLIGETVEYAD